MFDPVAETATPSNPQELFYCESSGANGRGLYTEEGFVVLSGSTGRKDVVPSIANTSDGRMREPLLKSGVLKVDGDKIVFTKDHLFRTPSGAALVLLGRTANGWVEWKTEGRGTRLIASEAAVSERVMVIWGMGMSAEGRA